MLFPPADRWEIDSDVLGLSPPSAVLIQILY